MSLLLAGVSDHSGPPAGEGVEAAPSFEYWLHRV